MENNIKEPSLEARLTGSVTKGVEENSKVQPDTELEGGEYLQYPDGTIQQVVGEKHQNGGVKMFLPDGTKVVSSRLNVNPKDAKFLKNTFDIEISSKDTYASTLKKYDKQIGMTKLNEEQEKLFKTLKKKNDEKTTPGTARLNQEYLSLKIKEIEDKKKNLAKNQQTFFETIFNIQESNEKPETEEEKFAYGGVSSKNFENICTKYGISKEEGMEILGVLPKHAFGGTAGEGVDGPPKPTPWNKILTPQEQIIVNNQYTKLSGQTIVTGQNAEISEEDYDAFKRGESFGVVLNEVPAKIPAPSIQKTKVAEVPRAYMVMKNETPGSKAEWVTPEEYRTYKGTKTILDLDESGFPLIGGTNKRYTNYSDNRATFAFGGLKKFAGGGFKDLATNQNLTAADIDVALKNNEITKEEADQLELQISGNVDPKNTPASNVKVKGPGGKYVYYNDLPESYKNKSRGVEAVAEWVNSYENAPTYKYSEVAGQASKDRLWSLIDMWGGIEGITKESVDSANKQELDKIAGKLQDKLVKQVPELAIDYGLNVAPTRQGLEWLAKNKTIDPKEYPSLFKDGQPLRGSYDTPEARAAFKQAVKTIPEEKLKEYAEANYKDNEWYFRSLAREQVEFDNEDEYRKWLVDNKDKQVGESGFYSTGKEGAYVQPILYKEKEFKTKELADAWVKDRPLEDTYGAFYDGDEKNVFERPKYPEMETAEEVKAKEEVVKKEGPEIKNDITVGNKKYARMFASPDQNPLPPSPMEAHLMGETRLGRIDPVRIGVETQRQQASEALRFITQQYDHLPPEQRAAAIANAQASIENSINTSITQANSINASNIASSELFNIGQADREQEAGLRNKLSYEQRQFTAKAKTEEELRNYYDRLQDIRVSDFKNNQNLNLLQTFYPNYNLDYTGTSIDYDPNSNFTLAQGNVGEAFIMAQKQQKEALAEYNRQEEIKKSKKESKSK